MHCVKTYRVKLKKIDYFKGIHKYQTVLIIAISISVFTGILPSIISSDWGWFSRSGAILVIFGLYIIWLDYESDLNDNLDILLSGFNKHLVENTEEDEASIERIEANVSDKFNEVRKATKNRFQNIEFLIVAIGTLIWGYGDLINKFSGQSC